MAARYAWVLNLDAEHELEDPVGYRPSGPARRRLVAQAERIIGLVHPHDVVLWADTAAAAEGVPGRCWCPTPRALARLHVAGAVIPPAPSLAVLQRVNHRRFCHELADAWEAARYVEDLEALQAAVSRPSPTGQWVAKRAFGFSGRGRRRLRYPLEAQDLAFCAHSLQPGRGLLVEPWVRRAGDFVLHGWIGRGGRVRLGRPLWQVCSEFGVWQRSELGREGMLRPEEERVLLSAGEETAQALRAVGYFGPFGIDAFRYRDARGRLRFRPRVEINARFGMGWALGMQGTAELASFD